jgi:hypothetical protein
MKFPNAALANQKKVGVIKKFVNGTKEKQTQQTQKIGKELIFYQLLM